MKKIRALFAVLFLSLVCSAPAHAKVNVVATTTTLADVVRAVGGDRVDVKSVASPKYNIHFIQPKPSDVRNVQKADLFVFSGLDLEAWVDPLLEAAGKPHFFRGGDRNVDASKGVPLLNVPTSPASRSQGDMHIYGNPHYQMSANNIGIVARNILEGLKAADPDGAAEYDANFSAFMGRWESKLDEWRKVAASLEGKEIISYHDDIIYFADFLKLRSGLFLEPKPGIPPTPKHLDELMRYAQNHKVLAIVMPSYYPAGHAEALSKKIGVPVVKIAQNMNEVDGTSDVFSFFDTNIQQLLKVEQK
jgi:zinc/manganese transport system substrate-binding protein